jgi:hypothetical protein
VYAVLPDRRVAVDLEGTPDALIHEWLEVVDRKLREQEAEARKIEEE